MCWYLFTARMKILTSTHWHIIFSLFFSGDNTEVGLTRHLHWQCAPTKIDSKYSPLGYYTPYGKRLSDFSEENATSILSEKHLPETKFRPEDEDRMIPKTSEQTIQWSKNYHLSNNLCEILVQEQQSVWRSCTRTTICVKVLYKNNNLCECLVQEQQSVWRSCTRTTICVKVMYKNNNLCESLVQ